MMNVSRVTVVVVVASVSNSFMNCVTRLLSSLNDTVGAHEL